MKNKISPQVQEMYDAVPKVILKRTIIFLSIGIMLFWSFSALEFHSINQNGLQVVFNILKYFVWPDSQGDLTIFQSMVASFKYFLSPSSYPEFDSVISRYLFSLEDYHVPYLMYETIMIAVIGTLFGAFLSIPLAFVSSRNITGRFVSILGTFSITVIRTFPIFVWGIIFIKVKGGPFAGVLAIGVSSVGMISKMFIEAIEDIDKGILEALDSAGCTTLQKIRYGIIPQLSANFISVTIYRFEINVKNATILGMVGAGGIGFTLIDAIGSFNFGVVAVCLWGIIPVVLLIEYFSTRIRTKLTTGE